MQRGERVKIKKAHTGTIEREYKYKYPREYSKKE